MGIGDILCEYIYNSFLLIKNAIDVAVKAASTLLSAIETAFNTLMSLCKYVIDLGIDTITRSINTYSSWLSNISLNLDFSAVCDGLYKCNEFVESLLDKDSLLYKTIRKFSNFDTDKIYNVINDFAEFKSQICNFKISIGFGFSSAKSVISFCNSQCDKFINMLNKYREKIKKQLQKYLDWGFDFGTFDLLENLKKYFHCAIIDTDACSTLNTANSYFKNALYKMGFEEAGDGYKISSDVYANYINEFDSRINQLIGAKDDIFKLLNSFINSSQLFSSKNTFNLSENIFPGSLSFKDLKNGNWKNITGYQYLKLKGKEFKEHIKKTIDDINRLTMNDLLSNTSINDKTGIVEVNLTDKNNNNFIKKFTAAELDGICEVIDETVNYNINTENNFDITGSFYDEESDTIVSNLRAAIDISINHNDELKNKCQNKFNFIGYTSELDVIKSR